MEKNKEEFAEEQVHTEGENAQNADKTDTVDPIVELETKLKEKEDAYLRLFAEFDNFRKRSAKEKIELSKTAGKDVIKDFLPVLDDIHRAHANIDKSDDIAGIKEGINLILDKFGKVLSNKGLEEMNVIGEKFDAEFHEAITEIPAPSEEQKGTIIDEIEKGYRLNEVIIRYPKVVVGK